MRPTRTTVAPAGLQSAARVSYLLTYLLTYLLLACRAQREFRISLARRIIFYEQILKTLNGIGFNRVLISGERASMLMTQ